MKKYNFLSLENIKHFLYLISILILLCISLFIFAHSINNYTLLDHLADFMTSSQMSLAICLGAIFLIALFLITGKQLSRLSQRRQILISAIFALIGIVLQYFLLFHFQPVLRYDHLKVFDAGLEILNTGHLSLTAGEAYFGRYPFNISAAAFNSIILRLVSAFGIPEKYYMLSLQCVYIFLIDLGVFFSWLIVKKLHSTKTAALFLLLCVANPLLYICPMGCYTLTLMMPFLMGTLLCMIYMIKEDTFKRKCIFAFFAAVFLGLGSRIRATVFIAGIAFVIYLAVRKKSETDNPFSPKKWTILVCMFLFGGLLSFGGFTAYQNTFITEDYKDTRMPAIYYLMFAMNPDAEGSYNEADFNMISQCETQEEKTAVSIQVIKERLNDYGFSGVVSLIKTKLQKTWCDGTDDYRDFVTTVRNYGDLHSYIAGSHRDFFVLYAHIYHVAVMAMFCIAVIFALNKKCDSSYYLIFLTLLGGIVFYILWEAYYAYSFGFSLLYIIPAAESLDRFSKKRAVTSTAGGAGILAITAAALLLTPAVRQLAAAETTHSHYAVVQDMSLGETQPLLNGESITQTFVCEDPFNYIACKVYNDTGTFNQSIYHMELCSESGRVLAQQDFIGAEAENGGYIYLEVDDVIPDGKETFTIRLLPLHTTEEFNLRFGYYNTRQYDIYSEGFMTGLNSDERTDLAFMVYQQVTAGFFH